MVWGATGVGVTRIFNLAHSVMASSHESPHLSGTSSLSEVLQMSCETLGLTLEALAMAVRHPTGEDAWHHLTWRRYAPCRSGP